MLERRRFFAVAGASVLAVGTKVLGSGSDSDKPTFVLKNGTKEWRNKEGELHRTGGPAIIWEDGTEYWYLDGKQHRVGGPATIMAGGAEYWLQKGQYHRIGGPAIITPDGSRYWYQNNKLIRKELC